MLEKQSSLSNVRIVLVKTSHPGNIGAVARAMKTMRVCDLYLVEPQQFPSPIAVARAAGAEDILNKAKVVTDLKEALVDCHVVIGTSARPRSLNWPVLNPKDCAAVVLKEAALNPVAIVFGSERMGLTNEELDLCHFHLQIPSNPEYASLNIASAVQIVTYELQMAALEKSVLEESTTANRASVKEIEGFYDHLEKTLIHVGFLDPEQPRLLMRKMRRLFNRARLEKNEVKILRGILTSIQKK